MPNPQNVEPYKFKPGQSGNPKGKPRGALSMSTRIRNFLESNQKDWDGVPAEVLIRAQAKLAANGNTQAFAALAKYGYGDKVDFTSGGEPIQFINTVSRPPEDPDE